MAKSLNAPANDFIRTQRGISTIWSIGVKRDAVAYRYELDVVSIVPGRGGGPLVEKRLTKGADDGLRALNKDICYELLVLAIEQTQTFGLGSQPVDVIYDQKSILFSSVPLHPQRVEVNVGDDNALINDHYSSNARFTLELRPCNDAKVRLSDLSQYQNANGLLLGEDRSLRTFFELAFSMYAVNENTYTQIGAGKLFRVAPIDTDLGNGIALRPGLAKGVRVVEGATGRRDAQMSLVVDGKVSPYFKDQNLLKSVCEVNGGRGQLPPAESPQWRNITRYLKDIRVITLYGDRKRTFPISGFTEKPIGQIMIDQTDKATGVSTSLSLPAYFERKYSIKLQHPGLPGVRKAGPGQADSVYPLELLEVMRDQRVPLEKMESRLSERLLQLNAVRPNERRNNVMEHLERIGALRGNDVLKAFGIQLLPESNIVSIGVRNPPELVFGRGQIARPIPDKANWSRESMRYSYLQTRDVSNWVVLRSQQDAQIVDAFVDRLLRSSGSKGMRLARPQCLPLSGDLRDYRNFSSQLESALKTNPRMQYLLAISPKMDGSHDLLKYFEARNKRVITQQLAIEKVSDVVNKGQNQTLDNILHKINVKNFGLNYSVASSQAPSPLDIERHGTLVIGLDVAHPPPATGRERADLQKRGVTGVDSLDPSVVGIAANMSSNPHAFSGDYFYQTSRKEAIDPDQLKQRTAWVCRQWQCNNPGKPLPKHVVLLRDGVSEGQYAMVVEAELAALRKGCRTHDTNWKPKFLAVVATKRHANRFFQQNGGGQVENLHPGSVMQGAGVSRLDAVHLFMQAHYPLKGCGKSVMYTVVCDEIGVKNEQLQSFLMGLCYAHQIVYSAISLPEPVYQADELAKRGSNNYRIMKQYEGVPRHESGLPDYKAINDHLSYMNGGGDCTITRFTA